MPDMRFVLSERQSAGVLVFAGLDDSARSSTRKLFFSAEAKNSSSIGGMPVISEGNIIEIFEGTDQNTFGTLDASDVSDASGNLTVVQVSATLQVPQRIFQQLLEAKMDETAIWVELKAVETARDKYGFETATLSLARFSFLPKAMPSPAPLRDSSAKLDRIFWAVLLIGGALLWRLH